MRRDRPAPEYWDGREAQRHPNSLSSDERTVAHILKQLSDTYQALTGWSGNELPLDAAADVVAAYEALDDLTWHLPHVNLWCVLGHSRSTWSDGTRHDPSVMSAHLNQETAELWLPRWQRRYHDRRNYEYEWKVEVYPTSIINLMAADETPSHRMSRMGAPR